MNRNLGQTSLRRKRVACYAVSDGHRCKGFARTQACASAFTTGAGLARCTHQDRTTCDAF